MYKLVIADDEGKTTVVPVVRDEVSIGRAEGNTIRLTERNVSRHHAVLRKRDDAYEIEDQDSYNGTYVDGQKIDGPTPVKAGTEIQIGDYQLALHVDSTEITEGSVSRRMPEPSVPPPRLIMLTPPVPGAEFALSGEHMRLGRSEDLDVWINHRSISREHAEIFREDDSYRIVDLGSANGIRVNEEEIEEAVLDPYDVVKLGRVRLRYVPEAQHYVFDPEAEAAEDEDADEDAGPRSRAPLWMALGIVVVALLVGGVIIAYAGMPAAEADKQAGEGGDADQATVGAPPADAEQPTVQESVTACESALKDGNFQAAVEHAEAALGIEPDHEAAVECRTAGRAGLSFHEGHAALKAGDVDSAYASFQQIPEDNPFREHPSIAEAAEKYAEHHVGQAEEVMSDDPGQALEHLQKVLDMDAPPSAQEQKARELRRRLRPQARKAGRGAQGGSPSAEPDSGPSPFDQALECARAGDNACVVETLDGQARTAEGLALLIETYRTIGETEAAAENMKRFVQRFSDDRRASRYREFLDNQR